MMEEENLRNGGWLSWEGGHTVLCQISRVSRSLCCFCVEVFLFGDEENFHFLEMLILAGLKAWTMERDS